MKENKLTKAIVVFLLFTFVFSLLIEDSYAQNKKSPATKKITTKYIVTISIWIVAVGIATYLLIKNRKSVGETIDKWRTRWSKLSSEKKVKLEGIKNIIKDKNPLYDELKRLGDEEIKPEGGRTKMKLIDLAALGPAFFIHGRPKRQIERIELVTERIIEKNKALGELASEISGFSSEEEQLVAAALDFQSGMEDGIERLRDFMVRHNNLIEGAAERLANMASEEKNLLKMIHDKNKEVLKHADEFNKLFIREKNTLSGMKSSESEIIEARMKNELRAKTKENIENISKSINLTYIQFKAEKDVIVAIARSILEEKTLLESEQKRIAQKEKEEVITEEKLILLTCSPPDALEISIREKGKELTQEEMMKMVMLKKMFGIDVETSEKKNSIKIKDLNELIEAVFNGEGIWNKFDRGLKDSIVFWITLMPNGYKLAALINTKVKKNGQDGVSQLQDALSEYFNIDPIKFGFKKK